MFTWVDDLLAANLNKKFITQTHVYFGNTYFYGLETLWYKNYTDNFALTLQSY